MFKISKFIRFSFLFSFIMSVSLLGNMSEAFTCEITTETNAPLDGVYTDVTEEKKADFPNCVKALRASASIFQFRDDVLEFGINFESPEGKRPVQVYLERTGGEYEKVFDKINDYMWLFDKYEVIKSGEFDLSRPLKAVTGCIVVCVGDVAPELPDVDAYWIFDGEGTIDGRPVKSTGWWKLQIARNETGSEYWLSNLYWSEKVTYKDNEEIKDNGFQLQGMPVEIGSEGQFIFSNGYKYSFKQTDQASMSMTISSENVIDQPIIKMNYTSTKSFEEPETPATPSGSSSGGGGCSVGISISASMLILPLVGLIFVKIK